MTWAAGRPADAEAPSNEKPNEPPESPRHRVTSSSSSAIAAHWSSPLACHLPLPSRSSFFYHYLALARSLTRTLDLSARWRQRSLFGSLSSSSAFLSLDDDVPIPRAHAHPRAGRGGALPPSSRRTAKRSTVAFVLSRSRSHSTPRERERKSGSAARDSRLEIRAAHGYVVSLGRGWDNRIERYGVDASYIFRERDDETRAEIPEANLSRLAGKYLATDWTLNERAAPLARTTGPSPRYRVPLQSRRLPMTGREREARSAAAGTLA